MKTTIAPWLSVRDGAQAIAFYKAAFNATEIFHLEDPEGNVVSRLSLEGAEFWISGGAPGGLARIVLTVSNPDATFKQAMAAGATQVHPVIEEHGWRIGRIVDPDNHHWEISRPLDS